MVGVGGGVARLRCDHRRASPALSSQCRLEKRPDMNRRTALSLRAATAFGLAMASTSIATAIDNGQTHSDRTPECEAVVNAYFAWVTGCEGMPPSQVGGCNRHAGPKTLIAVRTRPPAGLERRTPARTVRPQAVLQRRRSLSPLGSSLSAWDGPGAHGTHRPHTSGVGCCPTDARACRRRRVVGVGGRVVRNVGFSAPGHDLDRSAV